MKQVRFKSPFYHIERKIKVKDLLRQLTDTSQNTQRDAKAVHQIIETRLHKMRQLTSQRSKQISQEVMKPAKITEYFSQQKPIASAERFLPEKKRLNLISPDKIYSSKPNVRAGSIDELKKQKHFDQLNPKVLNKKFLQYTRIIEQQTGAVRRKKLQSLSSDRQNSFPSISPMRSTIRMKKTFFKKYATDKFNFYKPAIQNITRVFELTSPRSSLDGSRSLLQSQAMSKKSSTIATTHESIRKMTRHSKTIDLYRE